MIISTIKTMSKSKQSSGSGAQPIFDSKANVGVASDLRRLLFINAAVLLALLLIYYTNRSSGYLEKYFAQIFN